MYPKVYDTLFGRAEDEYGEEKYVATCLLKDKCEHLSVDVKIQSV